MFISILRYLDTLTKNGVLPTHVEEKTTSTSTNTMEEKKQDLAFTSVNVNKNHVSDDRDCDPELGKNYIRDLVINSYPFNGQS